MRRLIIILAFLVAGCATPISDQKSSYQEISKQDLINLVQHHPTGPDTLVWYAYAGSDAEFDYLYSFVPNVFPGHNSDFHYYKLKTGILNLPAQVTPKPWGVPARANFGVSKNNPMILSNSGNDTQSNAALAKLLNP